MVCIFCTILFACLILCIVLEVWGNTYATNIHCLVLLQKRVIRLICGAKRLDHTNLLFHNIHILKIPDLVKLKTYILTFKAYRYILPMNVHTLFRIHESRYAGIRQPEPGRHSSLLAAGRNVALTFAMNR